MSIWGEPCSTEEKLQGESEAIWPGFRPLLTEAIKTFCNFNYAQPADSEHLVFLGGYDQYVSYYELNEFGVFFFMLQIEILRRFIPTILSLPA